MAVSGILAVDRGPLFDDTITHYEYHSHAPYASSRYGNNDEIRIPMLQQDVFTPVSYTHLVIPWDVQSNLSVGNVRITQLAPPVNNKDAVNLEFLNEHTIASLNGTWFNAQGKTILNVGDGGRVMGAVNLRQLQDVRRYASSEMNKLANVFQKRWEKVVSYIYKLHAHAARSSLNAEEAELIHANNEETSKLIEELDKAGGTVRTKI